MICRCLYKLLYLELICIWSFLVLRLSTIAFSIYRYSWTPKDKFIAVVPSECQADLVYSVTLVKAGKITFEYQYPAGNSIYNVRVRTSQQGLINMRQRQNNISPPKKSLGGNNKHWWHRCSILTENMTFSQMKRCQTFLITSSFPKSQ